MFDVTCPRNAYAFAAITVTGEAFLGWRRPRCPYVVPIFNVMMTARYHDCDTSDFSDVATIRPYNPIMFRNLVVHKKERLRWVLPSYCSKEKSLLHFLDHLSESGNEARQWLQYDFPSQCGRLLTLRAVSRPFMIMCCCILKLSLVYIQVPSAFYLDICRFI